MAFKDNREFIEALEKTGDVVVVKKEVDWDMEAGAISRRACELSGPAILFQKIKDYPEGYRIFAAPVATYRRVAIAMGLPADTPIKTIYDEYERREEDSIPPVVVKNGPCKENILLGDDIDLYRLPSPMCHDGDGGRYIGTWGFVASKDLDNEWTNWGMYRFHVNNQRSLAMSPAPGSNLGMVMRQQYLPQKLPLPVAAVVGADPLSSIAASAGYAVGRNEADLAGGLRQEPVELIKCETNDLLVPAHAEIVIEGEILPDVSAAEGPFGEYPGYRSRGFEPKLYCRVTAITYRNSPILTMSNLGVPPDDSHVGGCLSTAVSVKRRVEQAGVPVVDCYVPPEGAAFMAIVSVKKGGNEVAQTIGNAIGRRRAWISKIIVVDDDVDVFDMRQVIHALSVKCHSTRGIFLKDTPPGTGNPFSPCDDAEEKKHSIGAVAVFDCTWPSHWPKDQIPVKASFNTIYPQEIRDRVLANWSEYGL